MRNVRQGMALVAFAALGAAGVASSAQAELIVNGGFEAPTVPSGYTTLTGNQLPGWSIDSGNVDLVTQPPYVAYEGTQALDLVGTGVSTGSISQSFATTAGQGYQFTFAYTNNTDSTDTVSGTANIAGTGSLLSTSVSHGGGTVAAPNWLTYSGFFTADSTSATLSFADTSGHPNQGLFLDAVSITAVPEPATWAMMVAGFGVAGMAMRRRRTTAFAIA